MAYAMWDDKVNRICSCCSCCCGVFSSVLRFSMFPGLISSDTVSVTDMNECESCGTCVDGCQFGAREITDNKLRVNNDLCYGCARALLNLHLSVLLCSAVVVVLSVGPAGRPS